MRTTRPLRGANTFRATVLSATSAVLVALLAGCGGDAHSAAAPPPPLPRYTTLAQLGSAAGSQMMADRTAKITVTGGASGGPVQASTTGEGAIRLDPAGPSVQMTERIQQAGEPSPAELTLVVLPDQAFIKAPADAGSALPAGKPWLRIDPNATDPLSQQFAQLVGSLRSNADPTRSFTQFGDAASILSSAEEPLDGVRAVRYQIRVDVAKAAAQERDPVLQQELGQTAASGMSTVDSSLWLDDHNRPLRVLLRQPLPNGQGTYTVDARYRDWGQPVQISAPPADQVAPS